MRYFVKHGCKGLQGGEDSKADSCFVTQELRLAWDVVNMPRRNIRCAYVQKFISLDEFK